MWLQKHLFKKILKNEKVWNCYLFMFNKCEFKIYKNIRVFYFKKKLYKKTDASAKWRLKICVFFLYKLLLTLLLNLRDLWLSSCLLLLTEKSCRVTLRVSKKLTFCEMNYLFKQDYKTYLKDRDEETTKGNFEHSVTVNEDNRLAALCR